MATTLYFRRRATTDSGVGGRYAPFVAYTQLATGTTYWATNWLSTSQGASVGTQSCETVSGPTGGVEFSGPATGWGGWISPPLAADVTISGTITCNLRGAESSMSANTTLGARVGYVSATTGAFTEIVKGTYGTEIGTSETTCNFNLSPSSTTVHRGDRICIFPYADDYSGGNMGSGYVVTFYYNGAASATGDSYVTFTETLSFESTPAGTTVYPTTTSAGINPGSATEYEAWTSRGSGVATAVTNTATGPTDGIQVTATAGGTAVEWYTKQLAATTLSGPILVHVRGAISSPAAYAGLRCEIAICASDGTSPTVWGTAAAGSDSTTNRYIDLTVSEASADYWVSGDDATITAGQRIRIRFYVDDAADGNSWMATGYTATLYYAGSAGATGDTYLTFTQTLSEYTSGTSVNAGAASGTGTVSGQVGNPGAAPGAASGTGTAQTAIRPTQALAPAVSGTGTSQTATAALAAYGTGAASGTGTAQTATAALAAYGTGVAAGTGTAESAVYGSTALPGAATGAGTGQGGTSAVDAQAPASTGTGTAEEATVTAYAIEEAAAGEVAGTGTAPQPVAALGAQAPAAAGTGAANDATVTAYGITNASAGLAEGTGTAEWSGGGGTTTVGQDSFTESGTGTMALSAHTPEVGAWGGGGDALLRKDTDFVEGNGSAYVPQTTAVSGDADLYVTHVNYYSGDPLDGDVGVIARKHSTAETYYLSTVFGYAGPSGYITLHRVTAGAYTQLGGVYGKSHTPARMHLQVSGSSPTVLRARSWDADGAEPGTWDIDTSDNTAGNQMTSGKVGVYLSYDETEPPVIIGVADDFLVTTPGGGALVGPIAWESIFPAAAAGTGTAETASGQVRAPAGASTGTGTAEAATVTTFAGTSADAPVAAGTGASGQPTAGVGGAPGEAAGTDAAGQPAAGIAAVAPAVVGTGAAESATVTATPFRSASPDAAAGTGTGAQPAAGVGGTPAQGAGTGTAHDATVTTAAFTSADAGLASGTGTAEAASDRIDANAEAATATGTALDPTATTSALAEAAAGLVAGTATAHLPTPAIADIPDAATATGTAGTALPAGGAAPGAGTGTAAGQAATPALAAIAPQVAGTGTAADPTVTALTETSAAAGLAAGVATAWGGVAALGPMVAAGTGTGTAHDPTITIGEPLRKVPVYSYPITRIFDLVEADAGVAAGRVIAYRASTRNDYPLDESLLGLSDEQLLGTTS